MQLTTFEVPKMDCPSEESLIRLRLESTESIKSLNVDLTQRRLTVLHTNSAEEVLASLTPLRLGARIVDSVSATDQTAKVDDRVKEDSERRALKLLLCINAGMFLIESFVGVMAQSVSLIADSLDMFADAAVYGLSFYAVGKTLAKKKAATKISGLLQVLLALGVLFEVGRRFFYGSEPEPPYMIVAACIALMANVSCLYLLSKHRTGSMYMKASWIFSTNDVIANIGVILAGVLILFTKSQLPDLVMGLVIAVVVFRGAVKILALSSAAEN